MTMMMSQNIIISSGGTEFTKIWIEDKLKCNLSTKRWSRSLFSKFLSQQRGGKGAVKVTDNRTAEENESNQNNGKTEREFSTKH